MNKTVVVYHSGYGHTQRVAQHVAEGAGAELLAIDAEGNLPEGGWDKLNAADAIIFGTPASYEQQPLPEAELRGRWRLVASPDGAAGSTTIGQDAKLWASLLGPGEALGYDLAPRRLAYVHVIRGRLAVNGHFLATGDAAKIADETRLDFQADEETEFLLFDLPPLSQ